MMRFLALIVALGALLGAPMAHAADTSTPNLLPDRILGKPDAPVTIDEYVSLTCSHCAAFYNNILPELEKKYVETGKVKFVLHDFPIDGISLKAAALARCMPEDEYYPFIKTLYKNQPSWANENAEASLLQYARLGGLDPEKAKACFNDSKMQDAIITARTEATDKLNVQATPTFVFNHGADMIMGAQDVTAFSAVIDRQLAAKK